MFLHERIRSLRKEKGWSQIELAERSKTDPRQISRYENGHITPSVEVMIRLARTLDITMDYLLIEDAQKRPINMEKNELMEKLYAVEALAPEDRETLLKVLEALVAKSKVKKLIEEF